MAIITQTYLGETIIQTDLPYNQWICSNQENAKWQPNIPDNILNGTFYNTHHPIESDNVSWTSAKLDLTRSSTAATPNYNALISLYGIQINGQPELIGEQTLTTINTTPTTDTVIFNLAHSGSTVPLTLTSGSSTSNTIQLNLPFRYQNIEELTIEQDWLENYTKCKYATITGSSVQTSNEWTFPGVSVTYDTDMNADFSDLRFMIFDGNETKTLCHNIVEYTASTSAIVDIYFSQIPLSANWNLLMFYGNSGASTGSTNTFYELYDNFDDNSYDTTIWTKDAGNGTITEQNQRLEAAIANGVNGFWSNAVHNSPISRIPVPSSDFEVIFKIESHTMTNETGGGIAIYQDYTNVVQWIIYTASGVHYIMGVWIQPSGVSVIQQTTFSSLPIWLKIRKAGTTYYFDYSTTGIEPFTNLFPTPLPFTPSYLGLHALNNNPYPAVTVPFNNFRVINNYSTPPTIGSWSAENSTINVTPNTTANDDTHTHFTWPSTWSQNIPIFARVKEYDSTSYDTVPIYASTPNIFSLGYDGVDKYHALRFKVDVTSDDDCTLNVDKIDYTYQI